MAAQLMIGQWVARFRGEVGKTYWHLVESEIADRKVTKCGREMGHIEGTRLVARSEPPAGPITACMWCSHR